jgi:GNAT superfamily N-acetyltransferase
MMAREILAPNPNSCNVEPQIRTMREHEIALATEWAAREGWNPGLADDRVFGTVDSNGFFVAEASGEQVGTISAVCYDDDFAFVGFYIVAPAWRGRGIGRALWNAAMEHVGSRNAGLDGVPAQVPFYERSGFVLDHRNVRYCSRGGGNGSGKARAIERTHAAAIVEYDRRCFPALREGFIRAWIAQPNAVSRCIERDGSVAGYGTIRRCMEGWKIGPLFADDASTAHALFEDLRCHAGAQEHVYLDVPSANRGAVTIARDAGMQPVFETARMYTNGRPSFSLERCFGVTSFELG